MNDSLDDIKRKALEERRAGLVEEYQALHKQLNHMLNAADRLKVQRQIDALEAEIRDVEEKLAALAPTQTVPVLIPTVPERPGPNPFTYGSAVPPKHFYGRARQRDDIRHRIGGISAQCVSVVGFRRSGKSSLLRYVRERIDEFYQAAQPPIVVYLDFQHKRFHSPAGITEGLRRSIAQQHSQSRASGKTSPRRSNTPCATPLGCPATPRPTRPSATPSSATASSALMAASSAAPSPSSSGGCDERAMGVPHP